MSGRKLCESEINDVKTTNIQAKMVVGGIVDVIMAFTKIPANWNWIF